MQFQPVYVYISLFILLIGAGAIVYQLQNFSDSEQATEQPYVFDKVLSESTVLDDRDLAYIDDHVVDFIPDVDPELYGPITIGRYAQNNQPLELMYFCSDVCPVYGFFSIYFVGVDHKKTCYQLGGKAVMDAAWGGYIGCEPRSLSQHRLSSEVSDQNVLLQVATNHGTLFVCEDGNVLREVSGDKGFAFQTTDLSQEGISSIKTIMGPQSAFYYFGEEEGNSWFDPADRAVTDDRGWQYGHMEYFTPTFTFNDWLANDQMPWMPEQENFLQLNSQEFEFKMKAVADVLDAQGILSHPYATQTDDPADTEYYDVDEFCR